MQTGTLRRYGDLCAWATVQQHWLPGGGVETSEIIGSDADDVVAWF